MKNFPRRDVDDNDSTLPLFIVFMLLMLVGIACTKQHQIDTVDAIKKEVIAQVKAKAKDTIEVVAMSQPPAMPIGKSIIIKKNDCYWKIAIREYNDAFMWPQLWKDNRDILGGNPELIEEGASMLINKNITDAEFNRRWAQSYK